MLEAVLEILLELAIELLLFMAGELGLELLSQRRTREPLIATLLWFVAGASLGGLWSFLSHSRLVPDIRVLRIATLFGSPILAGACMHWFGRYRRSRGANPSSLATFYGGASFSFGLSLVRFLTTM